MNINALKSLNGAALIAGIVGAVVGFFLAAERGLSPAADGSEPLTAVVIIAFAAAAVGLAGGILSMPKPNLRRCLCSLPQSSFLSEFRRRRRRPPF